MIAHGHHRVRSGKWTGIACVHVCTCVCLGRAWRYYVTAEPQGPRHPAWFRRVPALRGAWARAAPTDWTAGSVGKGTFELSREHMTVF